MSGDDQSRMFEVSSLAPLTLDRLMVTNGNTVKSGAALSDAGSDILGDDGTLEVIDSTISGHNAGNLGGGTWSLFGGTTLENTTVANSDSSDDCSGIVADGGFNLSSDDTCSFAAANHSLFGVDPLLGPLADNGGPTTTHALLAGSPATNKVNNTFAGAKKEM